MLHSFVLKGPSSGKLAGQGNILSVGDFAPDAVLTDVSGQTENLSTCWTEKSAVLVFMRHFGCPFCREQVSRLKEDYAKIVTANADVVCIGQGPYKAGKAFSIYFNLPFSVLVCGDDLSVYRNYGLDKGTPNQLFGINVLLRSLAVFKFGVGKVDGDPKQMPGAFIVDPTGKVLYVHRAKNQADYISTQDILKALDKTNR